MYKRAKKLKKYGAFGGMVVTRNIPACYVAPSTALGSYSSCCGNSSTSIGNGGWSLGAATAAGGLIAGIYDVPFSTFVQLNQVINYTDFSALFDVYQIRAVTYYITVSQSAVSTLGVGSAGTADTMLTQPSIVYYPDYDDANLPTVESCRERMGVKSKQLTLGKTTRITVRRPRADLVVLGGGSTVGAGVAKGNQWVDTAVATVPHFGLKGFFKNMDLRPRTDVAYQITIEAKVTLGFKHVR